VWLTLLVGLLVTSLPLSTPTSEAPLATASALRVSGQSPVAPASPGPVPPVERPPAAQSNTAGIVAPSLTSATTMPAAVPTRLQIPAIGVDSTLMDLGLQADGTLEVPPSGFPAGWYTGAPTPGELGPAIIAGHVDWAGKPGVFYDLRGLAAGDRIEITRQDGSTARFRVTRVARYAKDAFPTAAVYGDLDHAGLRLITCGGAFDPQARSYQDNLVAFAELVGSHPASARGRWPTVLSTLTAELVAL